MCLKAVRFAGVAAVVAHGNGQEIIWILGQANFSSLRIKPPPSKWLVAPDLCLERAILRRRWRACSTIVWRGR